MLFGLQSIVAQETIKTMFYNLLNFPSTQPSRVSELKTILDDIQPDLFLVCELETEQGGDDIFDNALATSPINYAAAPFVANQSTGNQLQQLAYYNSDKLILDNATTLQNDIVTTDLRDINRYSFVLNTADAATNPVYLEVFVTHLKAGRDTPPSTTNADRRLLEVRALTDYLNTNAATFSNRYVLFAGDFNLYTANEEAFQEIIDVNGVNAVDFIDPINRIGEWSNNTTFQDVHTQSTLRSNGHLLDENGFPDGATGGLDDRFDFIMISDNLVGNPELEYVTDSYETYGNNGNCYNDSINDSNCTGTYSQSIRNSLFNFSDHLPVVLDLETNLSLLNTSSQEFVQATVELPRGNVVQEQLLLKINDPSMIESVSIVNTVGQEMEQILIRNTSEAILDVSTWSKGMYFINIEGVEGRTALKFIKR